MMKAILQFLKRVASSRVGHVLLIIHLSLVVFDFAQKTPVSRAENNRAHGAGEVMPSSILLAGRGFHYHYESSLLKLLILVDLPGLVLSLILGLVLVPINYVAPLGRMMNLGSRLEHFFLALRSNGSSSAIVWREFSGQVEVAKGMRSNQRQHLTTACTRPRISSILIVKFGRNHVVRGG